MADITFYCPQCNQKITCDQAWSGHALQCPSCAHSISVPHDGAVPTAIPTAAPVTASAPPPPPPPVQPSLGYVAPPPAGRAPIGGSRPSQQTARTSKPVYRKTAQAKEEKKNVPMLILKIVFGGAVFCVAFYFAFTWASGKQSILNKKADDAAKNSDGGQVGHIADLYSVLEATEGAMGGGSISSGDDEPTVPRRGRRGADADAADMADPVEKPLPVIPPVWTLDVLTAKIPEGRANGSISGTNFVVDSARLDMAGGAPVLTLRQGTNALPDREMLVYLRVKPGEKIAGGAWAVAKEMKGAAVPKVAKRWKPNPKFAATMKSFDSGYSMRLEFGEISDGEVTGKIFLSLPDAEQSVVGGIFKAGTSLPDTTNSFRTNFRMNFDDN